ncbi:hepatic and glial cell adhesion molecule-like [Danio aesculapii]|uniref:hepatic and glial cell adhesion molecule-like n=1 Tax=Danio aesculapii TaxID=1142201 RepID=UPI0024C08910|nr:hepatic and glial cell adhesion molecule-like [Danio aesculapii]
MNSNYGNCIDGPYVFDSKANNNQNNIQYIGDKTSDCSLLISDINVAHSGEYKFRIVASDDRWTGYPGVHVSVHDLKVSMSRSRINGSTITGDSVNLSCSLDCPDDLSEVQWFKNGELMKQTNPILIFNSIIAEDSGNYSCSLRNFTNTLSKEFSIYIEDVSESSSLLIIVLPLVSIVFIIALFLSMLILRGKANILENPKEEEEGIPDSDYTTLQITAETQASAVYSTIH